MIAEQNQKPTILLVDDERAYLDAYSTWLDGDFNVRLAANGDEALANLDPDVDIVLLDRRMPDLSGDEVLQEIRSRDINCRIAMVTAVEPEFDIIEMPFDDYLVKPVSKDDLVSLANQLVARSSLDEEVQKCFALASKKSTLEANVAEDRLSSSPEYTELIDRLNEVEAKIGETLQELIESGSVVAAYRDLQR